jgi:hypothetical protein
MTSVHGSNMPLQGEAKKRYQREYMRCQRPSRYSVRSMLVRRCGRNACSSIRAPIIAVLAQPDNQELGERADAYNRLIKDMAVLPVAAAPAQGRNEGEGAP